MVCLSPLNLGENVIVPCGHCMPCRINRVRAWTIRILMEYESFGQKGLFITLTYDNEHLPLNQTLVKSDLQKFLKRLRRDLGNRRIKYFACGEYGTKTQRPHYHLIVLGLDDNDRDLIKENWTFCDWLCLPNSAIGSVCADSIRYVCGYVQKKLYGSSSKIEYESTGRIPPFQLQSQGLGLKYFEAHKEEYINTKGIPFKGTIASIPRYFKEKCDLPKDLFDELAEVYSSESYKDYVKKCKEAWSRGLHGKKFREFVFETEQTELNFQERFRRSKGGKI